MKNEKSIDASILPTILRHDNETGKLYWLPRIDCGMKGFNCNFAGKEAMTCVETKGYLNGRIFDKHIKAHRVVWALHYGEWPVGQIDHINGIKSDNRIENLRVVSNTTNCRNQSKPKSNTSGWLGVSWHKRVGMWQAKYKADYKTIHVGYYNCVTSAGIASMVAMRSAGFHNNHGRV